MFLPCTIDEATMDSIGATVPKGQPLRVQWQSIVHVGLTNHHFASYSRNNTFVFHRIINPNFAQFHPASLLIQQLTFLPSTQKFHCWYLASHQLQFSGLFSQLQWNCIVKNLEFFNILNFKRKKVALCILGLEPGTSWSWNLASFNCAKPTTPDLDCISCI